MTVHFSRQLAVFPLFFSSPLIQFICFICIPITSSGITTRAYSGRPAGRREGIPVPEALLEEPDNVGMGQRSGSAFTNKGFISSLTPLAPLTPLTPLTRSRKRERRSGPCSAPRLPLQLYIPINSANPRTLSP